MNVIESIREHEYGDNLAVIDGETRFTYNQFYTRVDSLSQGFIRLGVKKGDVVLAWLPNSFQAIETELACMQIGAIWVTLHAGLTWSEVHDVIRSTDPTLLVSDGNLTDPETLETLHENGLLCLSVNDGYEALIQANVAVRPEFDVSLADPARLRYTSGTTGRVKAAVLSHAVYKCSLDNLTNELHALSPDDRVLHAAPLTHASGALMYPILAAGGINVVLPQFDMESVLKTIQDERITTMFCVPTMLLRLFADETYLDYDLSSLRTISYGGAAMPAEKLIPVIEILGPRLMQIYGLTEATHPITTLTREDHRVDSSKLGSIGRMTPFCELKIVDGQGETITECGPEHVGEFFARGPNCMDGYWRDPEATAESMIEGWVATGDLGYVDADGYYWVVDRKKDVIISGGFNVYSAEIEHVLMGHTDVLEVAVVGMPHAEWGEEVQAVVVVEGNDMDAETLRAYCRKRLAGYKTPKQITIRSEPLPKNRSGKVLKRAIVEELNET